MRPLSPMERRLRRVASNRLISAHNTLHVMMFPYHQVLDSPIHKLRMVNIPIIMEASLKAAFSRNQPAS